MKKLSIKIVFIALLFIGIFSASYFYKDSLKNNVKLTPGVLGLPDAKDEFKIEVNFNNEIYKVNWYEIENTDSLYLLVNQNRQTSQEFINQNECLFLSSGGYYKSDYSPTGLLISEYSEVSPYVNSSLTNGIFSINDFATPRITSQIPRDRLRLALQAGPLLKENGEFVNLSLRNDEEARRVVLGVTGENKTIFMIFYKSDSVLLGPCLKDLPEIIKEFQMKTGIIFADAINLDGGSPTVFKNENTNFTESTMVGNFFCLK